MSETLLIGLALGNSKAGIADLRAQLKDTAGVNVGAAVSTGFYDGGNGFYSWYYTAYPDAFRGSVKFYSDATPLTTLAMVPVNPLDVTVFPSGANEVTITVENSSTHLPIDGASVWITTDLAGTNTIWAGSSDSLGVARNVLGEKPFLNTGTYYAWIQDSGYTDDNPQTLNVSP